MHETLITAGLVILTLLSLAAWAMSIRSLRSGAGHAGFRDRHAILWAITLGSGALFLAEAAANGYRPLTAHVDGLTLIAALFGATILYLQRRPRMEFADAFALPLLTLLLAWAVCASRWTYFRFDSGAELPVHRVWMTFHLIGVYGGTFSSAIAAMAGAMFLYVQHRLHLRRDLPGLTRLASLETLEKIIIRQATLGFSLLTLALVTGLVIATAGPTKLGEGWWHTPKVILAAAAWLVFALLMNARAASTFRGTRAAWLGITGLVLLLATLGVVNVLPARTLIRRRRATPRKRPDAHPDARHESPDRLGRTSREARHSPPTHPVQSLIRCVPLIRMPRWYCSPPATARKSTSPGRRTIRRTSRNSRTSSPAPEASPRRR